MIPGLTGYVPQDRLASLARGEQGLPDRAFGAALFADLLRILKNPKHPEHQNMTEWLGGPFDAEAFDLEDINRWLGKLKWPRVTEAQLRKALMGRDSCHE